jgi:crotonobetainyl-CoA:carnitine CoA-transferase CaiB-like acyl-CoA transferase
MNTPPPSPLPLAGVSVVEIAGGTAAAWCGRLLADAGASVTIAARSREEARAFIARDGSAAETRYAAWLETGKAFAIVDDAALAARCATADLVLSGEAAAFDSRPLRPRRALVALDWFGQSGDRRGWRGNDLIVQALTGLPHMVGHAAGPPTQAGDRQSLLIAGVTAYIAALAGLLAPVSPKARRFDIGIVEANLVVSEMHMHFFEKDGVPMRRCGVNRFLPNAPVGVYRCRDGWVGITATTPEQWKSLCRMLDMHAQGEDESLATRERRFARLDEVETTMTQSLARRSALEWAELGRAHKVPVVIVPDAAGVLSHPIFTERGALASFGHDGRRWQVPRAPFGLGRTPVRAVLDEASDAVADDSTSSQGASASATAGVVDDLAPPLAGLSVVDFAMGWAGPLATRLLADLGADVVKIEAGRYPDWWRGVNWSDEYIRNRQYEDAKGFCALNRGKRGVSVDLTTEAGKHTALALIGKADLVVENQAAGVMAKLGLGHAQLSAIDPSLVMVSMSAFGTGNAWSDTRAYGSTLEQGAGLPSFTGFAGDPPTMYQLAYGDPIGGLYGCAAGLTALFERRRSGRGQYVNLSMIEAMLPFTAPALLAHQAGTPTPRLGNAHPVHAPHGIWPAAGADQWLALAVDSDAAFARFARLLDHPEWVDDPRFIDAAARRAHARALDEAIVRWSRQRPAAQSAALLQRSGVIAAPVLHADQIAADTHLQANGFFIDLTREFSGPQRQAGSAFRQNGRRLGARTPAPLLGEHTWEVVHERLAMPREHYDELVRAGTVTFEPTGLRAVFVPPPAAPETTQ